MAGWELLLHSWLTGETQRLSHISEEKAQALGRETSFGRM